MKQYQIKVQIQAEEIDNLQIDNEELANTLDMMEEKC